ncbi:hypothetical protein NCCP2495_32290 [Dietzia sp. NCCP-2495]|nr:hypothetical protein NCCP2495_32290 [Dietzia sp. NCCP-2495]
MREHRSIERGIRCEDKHEMPLTSIEFAGLSVDIEAWSQSDQIAGGHRSANGLSSQTSAA